jgi:hypothetical protein
MRVPVGVRIIGRSINQVQMLFQFGEPGSRTSREPAEVGVLRLEVFTMATRPRCLERVTALRTCAASHISGASGSNPAIEPAITPVQQAKPIHLPIISRRFDQALPATPFSRPEPRQGRMKSHLHLILQIQESRVGGARATPPGRREADPIGQPQPDHERVEVRVSSYRLKEPLLSLAFPTSSAFSSALRRNVQVERLQT